MSLPILVDSYYFGHALYHARRRAKLTRDEVTKILGYPVSYINMKTVVN